MKFQRIFLLTAVFFFVGAPAGLAASTKLFEFAPDAWQSERWAVSEAGVPSLVFDAPVDFDMTGFDLWIDNPGTSGSASFTLSSNEGAMLAVRSATLSTIPAFPGGNKLHINWATPVHLSAGQTYDLEINSSLPSLGLYYGDRISVLEHNRDTPTPYALGAARIGGVLQDFTFKFAIYQESGEAAEPPPDQEETPEEEVPSELSISGARLVEVTDTTALFAWSTNIATDSKVSIRSHLNPLYVIASAHDPTLELEHTLLVTGLTPNVSYFADTFSSDGGQLTLTTYVISFKTLTVAAAEEAAQDEDPPPADPQNPPDEPENPAQQPPNQNPNPNPSENPANPQNPNQPSENQPQNQNNSNNPADSGSGPGNNPSQPGISISPGGGSGSVDITWNPPAGGEPSGGYRIDIFDYNYRLVRQILVPAGTHSATIAELTSGTNHAIVYADENGVFTKVAASKDFIFTAGKGDPLNKIIVVSVAWIAGLGGWFYWKSKKKNSTLQA